MNRQILRLAIPNIITNITVPLLSMVDTAIVGHLKTNTEFDYLGAIAIGTMIINFIYWNFGFLRMGTSGFTAQSYGRKDMKESINILTRACFIAICAAILLFVLQIPVSYLVSSLIDNKNNVLTLALRYFRILIWAAPATLLVYALKGWLIGMQDSKTPMFFAILINILNITLSLFFVIVLKMKIEGVALGTLLAQYGGLLGLVIFMIRKYGNLRKYFSWKESIVKSKMIEFFKINADIFLRTLCLIAVTCYFTIAGSKMPYPHLAVNTVMMQLFTLFSYFMDGFAYSAESLCGKFYGAKDKTNLQRSIKYILLWGLGLALLFMVIYALFARNILSILTNKTDVITFAMQYIWWVLLIPLTGFVAFLYDGILIGMTKTKLMRNAIFIATFLFFSIFLSLKDTMGNDALWLGFITYLAARSFFMWLFSKHIIAAQ